MTTGWKRARTSQEVCTYVDVDLVDFETNELLQALIDRKAITEADALRILRKEAVEEASSGSAGTMAGTMDELAIAEEEIKRGRREEALIHLERGLGGPWIGRLAS